MDKNRLKEIVLEQKESFQRDFEVVQRKIPKKIIESAKITVVTGIRRCGKSTLLRQIAKFYNSYNYINFEDERLLDFHFGDFNLLLEVFMELNEDAEAFFFDEIQNISGWERFCRRLFTDGHKLFVTGSNANLLSSEIATSLTGRNIHTELFPFSFREFLEYKGVKLKETILTKDRAKLSRMLEEYITFGGFPEILKSGDYQELNQLYQDILIKDLIVRLQIRDVKDFRELSLYLLSNVAKKISFNNLKNLLNFSSASKVKNYVDALGEAFLFFTVSKYDPSVKKQIRNEKKIYCIDSGLINATAFRFSREEGRILENIVFLELKRRGKEIFYEEDKTECDFLIKEGLNITAAIQVSVSLADEATRQREINGLLDAMKKYDLPDGLLLTKGAAEDLLIEERRIKIMPAWAFLLEG